MVQAPAVRVPRAEAESTRRRLIDLDVLRIDLDVAKDGDFVLFPVLDTCGPTLPTQPFEFTARAVRPSGYQDLLKWPKELLDLAPRAFDQLGDIIVVKVPSELAGHQAELGEALRKFHHARAVFADRGVRDEFRVRDLHRIAGAGEALTEIRENAVKLWVDLSKAYFSPRLATERGRVAASVRPGEHVVDLFAGVAPFAVQAAQRRAKVDAVDLNADAIALARRNVEGNKVADRVTLHLGDARKVAAGLAPAQRIIMNLPHGAHAFLDVAAKLAAPGAVVHYHEILPAVDVAKRTQRLKSELGGLGRAVTNSSHRIVRHYSPVDDHVVWDVTLE